MIIKFESQTLRRESLGTTLVPEVWTFSQLSKKKQELPAWHSVWREEFHQLVTRSEGGLVTAWGKLQSIDDMKKQSRSGESHGIRESAILPGEHAFRYESKRQAHNKYETIVDILQIEKKYQFLLCTPLHCSKRSLELI